MSDSEVVTTYSRGPKARPYESLAGLFGRRRSLPAEGGPIHAAKNLALLCPLALESLNLGLGRSCPRPWLNELKCKMYLD